jgi:hypothetical protein
VSDPIAQKYFSRLFADAGASTKCLSEKLVDRSPIKQIENAKSGGNFVKG